MGEWCVRYSLGKMCLKCEKLSETTDADSFTFLANNAFCYMYIKDKPFCLGSSPSHFLAHYVKQFREKFIALRGPNLVHFLGYLGKPHLENIFVEQIPTDSSCDAQSKHLVITTLQVYMRSNEIFNTNFPALAC